MSLLVQELVQGWCEITGDGPRFQQSHFMGSRTPKISHTPALRYLPDQQHMKSSKGEMVKAKGAVLTLLQHFVSASLGRGSGADKADWRESAPSQTSVPSPSEAATAKREFS